MQVRRNHCEAQNKNIWHQRNVGQPSNNRTSSCLCVCVRAGVCVCVRARVCCVLRVVCCVACVACCVACVACCVWPVSCVVRCVLACGFLLTCFPCLLVWLFLWLFLCLFVCLFVSVVVCLLACLLACLNACLLLLSFVRLFVPWFVRSCIHLFVSHAPGKRITCVRVDAQPDRRIATETQKRLYVCMYVCLCTLNRNTHRWKSIYP